MRLYKLLSRHGSVKRRLWPWFEAPAAYAPLKYDGWVWDPETFEWVWADVDKITIEVQVPRYPEPTEPPRLAQPFYVPGWYWNGRAGVWEEIPLTPQELSEGIVPGPKPKGIPGPGVPTEVEGWSWDASVGAWVATSIVAQRIGFEPPRSLPPNITQEAVFELYSFEQLFVEEVNAFVAQGYTMEAARRITRDNFDNLIRIMYAKSHFDTQGFWYKLAADISGQTVADLKDLTVIGVVILLAAVAGTVMGLILERVTFADDDRFMLVAKRDTYLLGPENWAYSKLIGRSLKGRTYYSRCGEIGTEYVRHKRARSKAGYDVIDFPGGFVETGYDFPYWVKFTWSHWTLQYIGMLSSSGERFYVLKKADTDPFARMTEGTSIRQAEWCTDFLDYRT